VTCKDSFGLFGILVAVAVMISVVTITTTSTNIIDNHAIINFAQAQIEAKVSIVPGASTLGERAFSPNPITVKVGDTVIWTNDDNQFHTVTSGDPSGGGETGKVFDSGVSGTTALTTKGKTFSHEFAEKGEFPYFCQLHPTMVGKVIVS
jgi:plastocyanin